jgi:hypothetical protein
MVQRLMGVAYGTQLYTHTAFIIATTIAEPPDSKKARTVDSSGFA